MLKIKINLHKHFGCCQCNHWVCSLFSSCKQWVNNCCRQDLASEPPEQLNALYRLCGKHFEPSMISHQVRKLCGQ